METFDINCKDDGLFKIIANCAIQ